jgi:hypothetical protein
MRKILLTIMAACLLAFTAAADIGPPGTVETEITGVSVDYALVCHATDLGPEAKELLRTWVDLTAKLQAGTLTEEEHFMGSMIAQSGACIILNADIPGTVVLLDGTIYLVDYCIEGLECIRVIQSSDGFAEDL